VPFRGIWAGGDWECPVAFIIYWDGSKLRAYVPTDGNSWNTDTKRAYGNEEKDGEDLKNMKKRWPEQYAEVEEADGGNAPEFNWELIFADIQARIIKK
jgi:hypothetical protein